LTLKWGRKVRSKTCGCNIGSPVSNIPGVHGVGEKTATPLLKEFGTVEGVFDNLVIIPEKLFLVNRVDILNNTIYFFRIYQRCSKKNRKQRVSFKKFNLFIIG
jgi:5'-3' exonuclease